MIKSRVLVTKDIGVETWMMSAHLIRPYRKCGTDFERWNTSIFIYALIVGAFESTIYCKCGFNRFFYNTICWRRAQFLLRIPFKGAIPVHLISGKYKGAGGERSPFKQ